MCIKQAPPNIKFGFKLEEIKNKIFTFGYEIN